MLSSAKYLQKMAFEITQGDHTFNVDAHSEHGGEDLGPSPKGLLLSGLIGCTGMDVVAILKKMHATFETFNLSAECELTDEHPKVFKDITIKYLFTGSDLDLEKIKKAVTLSMDKYCGVSAMLKKNGKINSIIVLNGEEQK